MGDHNHLGPGIRQMTVGEMEYILPDKTMIYRAGDFSSRPVMSATASTKTSSQYASPVRDSATGPEGGVTDYSQRQTPSVGFGRRPNQPRPRHSKTTSGSPSQAKIVRFNLAP